MLIMHVKSKSSSRFYKLEYECQSEHLYESFYVCVYCIHCRTSYVISLLVCFSESTCIKVCMIVFLVLYIVVRLILLHYDNTHKHKNFHTGVLTDTHSKTNMLGIGSVSGCDESNMIMRQ
jgi:hypothetical protein